jgi:phage-related minor tail protein
MSAALSPAITALIATRTRSYADSLVAEGLASRAVADRLAAAMEADAMAWAAGRMTGEEFEELAVAQVEGVRRELGIVVTGGPS